MFTRAKFIRILGTSASGLLIKPGRLNGFAQPNEFTKELFGLNNLFQIDYWLESSNKIQIQYPYNIREILSGIFVKELSLNCINSKRS